MFVYRIKNSNNKIWYITYSWKLRGKYGSDVICILEVVLVLIAMLLHIWHQWGEFTLHFCQPKCYIQSRRGWCALYNEKVISHTVYKHTHSLPLLHNILNRKSASVFRKMLQNVRILLFYRILFIYSTLCYLLRTSFNFH